MKIRRHGFTIVEMLFVLLIIGVLSSFAYTTYQESVRKSRRAQVKGDLQEIQQNMERFFTLNTTYIGFELNAYDRSPRGGPTVFYTIELTLDPANVITYLLTATPVGPHAADRCGVYTINQAGTRTPTTPDDCW